MAPPKENSERKPSGASMKTPTPPRIVEQEEENSPLISDELAEMLDSEYSELRQGACLAILRQLSRKTELSKTDLREIGKKLAPAVQVTRTAQPMAKQTKGASNLEGPKATAVKADIARFPSDRRGAGSAYAEAIRTARANDKAARAVK